MEDVFAVQGQRPIVTNWEAVTFPVWWPLRLVGYLIAAAGMGLVYIGACVHDRERPRLRDMFGGGTV